MTKKKVGGGVMLALLLGMIAGRAQAATSAALTIHVTVNASLSLNIGGWTDYNFGTIAPGTVVASTAAVTITNDSSGLVEDYTITSSTFIATGGTNWNLTGTLAGGADTFGLCAAINPTVLSSTTFVASDCLATSGAQQNMDTSHFGTGGVSGANTNGDHVAAAAPRNLWLLFAAPTSITTGNGVAQVATLTLTANLASLFP